MSVECCASVEVKAEDIEIYERPFIREGNVAYQCSEIAGCLKECLLKAGVSPTKPIKGKCSIQPSQIQVPN